MKHTLLSIAAVLFLLAVALTAWSYANPAPAPDSLAIPQQDIYGFQR